ncbi:hypothetical protein IMZ48_27955 [Candidatus Bathyarchaeota archaeon]|nr:hypothetical protein [Candidatus Bathyarchaeota archaeon]
MAPEHAPVASGPSSSTAPAHVAAPTYTPAPAPAVPATVPEAPKVRKPRSKPVIQPTDRVTRSKGTQAVKTSDHMLGALASYGERVDGTYFARDYADRDDFLPQEQLDAEPTFFALAALSVGSFTALSVPKSLQQARKRPNFESTWLPAMQHQLKALLSRGVWELVTLPEGALLLPGQWVFDVKTDELGNVVRYRARWVVCGNYQTGYWEPRDKFAAVAHLTSMRVFFAYVAAEDLECQTFDFDTAFLEADVPAGRDIYVQQPYGLGRTDSRVCLLNKALHGLKEASLWWFLTSPSASVPTASSP